MPSFYLPARQSAHALCASLLAAPLRRVPKYWYKPHPGCFWLLLGAKKQPPARPSLTKTAKHLRRHQPANRQHAIPTRNPHTHHYDPPETLCLWPLLPPTQVLECTDCPFCIATQNKTTSGSALHRDVMPLSRQTQRWLSFLRVMSLRDGQRPAAVWVTGQAALWAVGHFTGAGAE